MSMFKDSPIVEAFHAFYKGHHKTDGGPPRLWWRGVELRKMPTDLWVYQELIVEEKFDFIIEGGTCSGGSALFMADICELSNQGRVVTIDWDRDDLRPLHDRITYVVGDTLDPGTKEVVKAYIGPGKKMLILDDGHSQEHVEKELELWFDLLSTGDVLIIEDTDLGGPFWGLEAFLRNHSYVTLEPLQFAERFLLTQNPKGYYKVAPRMKGF